MKHAQVRQYRPVGSRARALRRAHGTAALRCSVEELERRRSYDILMQAPAPVAVLRGPNHTFELANPVCRNLVGPDASLFGLPLISVIDNLGNLFVNALKMQVDPLIMTSVISGVAGIGSARDL